MQRCLEAASVADERRKIVSCMRFVHVIATSYFMADRCVSFRSRVVELATNCYGCHVLQKALDCEEDIRLLIVSELLLGDPAQTLVNKHASHVWSKVCSFSYSYRRCTDPSFVRRLWNWRGHPLRLPFLHSMSPRGRPLLP